MRPEPGMAFVGIAQGVELRVVTVGEQIAGASDHRVKRCAVVNAKDFLGQSGGDLYLAGQPRLHVCAGGEGLDRYGVSGQIKQRRRRGQIADADDPCTGEFDFAVVAQHQGQLFRVHRLTLDCQRAST
ncbi:hypothetical protein D3C72_648100 [compost metagenome]